VRDPIRATWTELAVGDRHIFLWYLNCVLHNLDENLRTDEFCLMA
jgi:hypothetical protein